MPKLTKRQKAFREKVEMGRFYPVDDAFGLLQDLPRAQFPETIEVAVNLGVDPRKSDQIVRGSTVLPNGTGKSVRVAVFAQGDKAEAAKEAGADVVGMEELAEQIKGGDLSFNVVIASPDTMGTVGKLGTILGPRGLMPNPKVGTVTQDVATAVRNAKAGQVRYRTDKKGVIHAGIGKIDFSPEQLRQNLETLLGDLQKAKPAASKGIYMKKVTVASTMGPGIPVDLSSLRF